MERAVDSSEQNPARAAAINCVKPRPSVSPEALAAFLKPDSRLKAMSAAEREDWLYENEARTLWGTW